MHTAGSIDGGAEHVRTCDPKLDGEVAGDGAEPLRGTRWRRLLRLKEEREIKLGMG
jgi:hypothetical protein